METLKVSSPRYMGCSGVSICLKCAPYVRPIFQGRYYRFPSVVPPDPPFCYRVFNQFFKFVLLCLFFCWKKFFLLKEDGPVAPYLVGQIFSK